MSLTTLCVVLWPLSSLVSFMSLTTLCVVLWPLSSLVTRDLLAVTDPCAGAGVVAPQSIFINVTIIIAVLACLDPLTPSRRRHSWP